MRTLLIQPLRVFLIWLTTLQLVRDQADSCRKPPGPDLGGRLEMIFGAATLAFIVCLILLIRLQKQE
jgi:hypothetical protein